MSALDTIGAIGEVFSWIGLAVGLPFLLVVAVRELARGRRVEVRLSVLEDYEDRPFALWTIQGRTCSRSLSERELEIARRSAEPIGYASLRDPERMDLERRSHADRLCLTVACVMLGTAAVGFLASLASLL